MRKYLLALLLAGCGSEPYTWGDASSEISIGFCNRLAVCGFFGNNEGSPALRDACIAHAEFHLCSDYDCSAELPDQAREDSAVCVEATAEADCYFLGWYGALPAECGAIYEHAPES